MIKERSIREYFKDLVDPRGKQGRQHLLIDVIVISICAVISGADDWNAIEDYGKKKEAMLREVLSLPYGIPSHDTYNRVFGVLDKEAWQAGFMRWMQAIVKTTVGKIVSIDGKCLRGSKDSKLARSGLYIVSAWVNENELVLGAKSVAEKSNEISAIPELLEMLVLKGAIVTIDAMGCQKDITKAICEAEADYVIALKANQGTLYEDVKWLFKTTETEAYPVVDSYESFDAEHGRYETRHCKVIKDLTYLKTKGWVNLKQVIKVDRCFEDKHSGKQSQESRYYLTSLASSAKQVLHLVRSHWGIENNQHWSLDVTFHEDHSRIRADHAAFNMGLLRRLALNLLKQETSFKAGLKRKRFSAAMDDDYLFTVLGIPIS